MNGRASIFIGAVSAGADRPRLRERGAATRPGSTVFAVLVLTPLLFLGLVTFWRCLQIAIDDWEFSVRIMRAAAPPTPSSIPELAGLLAQADVDEAEVTMLSGSWQALQKMLSVAGSIAVISSAVLGADVGRHRLRGHRLAPGRPCSPGPRAAPCCCSPPPATSGLLASSNRPPG